MKNSNNSTISQKITYGITQPVIYSSIIIGIVDIISNVLINSSLRTHSQIGIVVLCLNIPIVAILVIAFILKTNKSGKRMAQDISDPISKLVKAANSIAEGNLDVDIQVHSGDEIEILADAFKKIVVSLKVLVSNANMLSEAATAGILTNRPDASICQGAFRKIVDGVNNTLDAVTRPLNVAAEYVDRISKGDIPEKITDDFNGEFNVIKNNLNTCIDAMNLLAADTDMLSEAAIGGILTKRADASICHGTFRKIVDGVNNTLDAVIKPLNTAAEYVDRISKGDIPEKITDDYNGEFDVIKNNLNTCIDALNLLVSNATMLSEAAIEGKLTVRADASKSQGAFRKVVDGVNNTLESIVVPLNEGDTILEKLAKNDFTSKVSGNYKGMLGNFANSVNDVRDRMTAIEKVVINVSAGSISDIELLEKIGKRSENDNMTPSMISMTKTIRSLIEETNVMATASFEGNLDMRSDASKFKGGYQQIIDGMNRTMEAVAAPIEESSRVLLELAQGNLTVEMTGDYKGDYNIIKTSLNQAIDSFNNLLSQINISASQVSVGSGQISDSSQSLSQGATEQASSVEELTASINEIASQTKQNAANAMKASEFSANSETQATQGNEKMSQLLNSMGEINESSVNISKIIKTIDDIAFQTNILALNAAVEAARAGQYGKGFAVVAEEVRNLAGKSAQASKETTALIEGSISKVGSGTKIANETACVLGKIVESAKKSVALVSGIAAASNEQATAIAQIDQGLSQVSTVVQTNSATSEECAASSEELSGQSKILMEMVEKFKLKNASSVNVTQNARKVNSNTKPSSFVKDTNKPKISLAGNFGKY